MEMDPRDVTARIARLLVYPVKSCAGVELEEARLCDTGLEFDRGWMVVDGDGEFLSQRELPRMVLIAPQVAAGQLLLRAPGMPLLRVAPESTPRPLHVQVWNDAIRAHDMGDAAARWLGEFLGRELRLVRFDPIVRRLSNLHWTGGLAALNQFSDGYPLLVTSEASLETLNGRLDAAGHAAVGMNRFRPNIVLSGIEAHDEDRLDVMQIATADGEVRIKPVKPCTRCAIPDIDPATAASSPEVNDALQAYRHNAALNGAVTFGTNAIVLQGVGQAVRVGQTVAADYRFD